jgi:hypothetical protein
MLPRTPQPPKFKHIEGAERIVLPPPDEKADSFFQTLRARRTQRTFSAPASLASIAKLLQTTRDRQGFIKSKYFGALPLKTSPSAGPGIR